jgi:hypothetical protein
LLRRLAGQLEISDHEESNYAAMTTPGAIGSFLQKRGQEIDDKR